MKVPPQLQYIPNSQKAQKAWILLVLVEVDENGQCFVPHKIRLLVTSDDLGRLKNNPVCFSYTLTFISVEILGIIYIFLDTIEIISWKEKRKRKTLKEFQLYIIRDNKAVIVKDSLIVYLFTCSLLGRTVKPALCPSALECSKLSVPLSELLAPVKAKFWDLSE